MYMVKITMNFNNVKNDIIMERLIQKMQIENQLLNKKLPVNQKKQLILHYKDKLISNKLSLVEEFEHLFS